MTRLTLHHDARYTRAQGEGAPLRTWFDPTFRVRSKDDDNPADLARGVLTDSHDLFGWEQSLPDLVDRTVLQGPAGASVRFEQRYKGIRVDAAEVVVNFAGADTLHSVYNGYHYDIPEDLPTEAKVDEKQAVALAERLLRAFERREVRGAELVVYQYEPAANSTGKPHAGPTARIRALATFELTRAEAADGGFTLRRGQYVLAWDVRIRTQSPAMLLRVLVDAVTGQVVNLVDLTQYATGSGQVFDPNPIVTGGDTTLRHSSAGATINAQRRSVSLEHLDAPSGGTYKLTGSHVTMQEEEAPTVAAPTSSSGTFDYPWDDNAFLDVMTYFHIDRLQEYIESTLGLGNVANYAVPVDPQGFNGIDNSHYVPGGGGKGDIAFGGGIQPIPGSNPVPDAADAMVVLHEYGHAIQDNSNPGFDNPGSGVGEGWGDTLAAIYYDDKHADPAKTRGWMMSWDSEMGTGSWSGRRYDMAWLFDGPEYTGAGDNHTAGQLWCATMFELYRKLGGDSAYAGTKAAARDLALRLHLMANFHVPTSGATAQQMGQQIEAADHALGGWRYADGLHHKVIYDTFARRHLAGYPAKAVDVYINDGRQGGYGSVSTNDAFTERLWLDSWWNTQDVWVKVTPYPDAAAQANGDPGDHVEPAVGSTAYLYVRVKNRGTSAGGSGPVTVKAFHADPGIGLTWPQDWTPMDTPSVTVANVLPGAGNAVVVGPFPWTPSVVGHECVFAIVECANDKALTQEIAASAHVGDGDLVPFDNNIAQRNLSPTPAKKGGTKRFTVRNPFDEPRTMHLHVDSTLPQGWRCVLPDDGRIHLGPRERRWVEVVIDQAEGPEVTTFERPQAVHVTGVIDGVPQGGMSFYLAPRTAFPGGRYPGEEGDEHGEHGEHGEHHRRGELADLLRLDVPWRDCDVEGEIDVRIRFRRR